MKQLYFISALILALINLNAQTQIGQDIDGESFDDQSGFSVSLSSDGSTVAIGAIQNDGNGIDSGHVRVYENIGGVWTQVGSDIDGEAAGDESGESVSLSSDGSIVAIGAAKNNGNGNFSGHVRVYENQGGNWVQIGSDIDGEGNDDTSGSSVSLSSNGNILAIAAATNSDVGQFAGQVRIYENINGNWIQIGQDINGEAAGDGFGDAVSISADGSIVAIGATSNEGNGSGSGHVRVYENISGTWSQLGQDIDGEDSSDQSGWSVDLSSDGSIVAIGAISNDDNGVISGHVRVYENIGGTWMQIGQDIDGEASFDRSGRSVSLSADGNIVAIGANWNGGNGFNSGHVRIYQNISGTWTQIVTDIDGEAAGDESGWSISLSSDGGKVAIGARLNGPNSGHVRVYDISNILSIESQSISNFQLYPNPAKDQFTIELKNPSDLNEVRIYNDLGQLVLASKETMINIEKLTSGLYMVEVETSKGKATQKLIIE